MRAALGAIVILSLFIGLGIKLMLPAIRAPRPPDFPQPGDRLEANRQDIAYLRATLHEMDRSFTPDQWQELDQALDQLNEGAGSLDAGRLEMGLAAAVAKSNNGHSNVMGAGWGLTLNSVPVRFYWFADGLYVLKTDPSYSDILGAKVLAIGGRTPDELVESSSAYTGGRSTLKRESAIHFMESPQAMHAVGLLDSPARMELSVVTLEGIAQERLITAVDVPVFQARGETAVVRGPARRRWCGATDGEQAARHEESSGCVARKKTKEIVRVQYWATPGRHPPRAPPGTHPRHPPGVRLQEPLSAGWTPGRASMSRLA